jgi:hypothetical protein
MAEEIIKENAKFIIGLNTDNSSRREIYSIALLRVLFSKDSGLYRPGGQLTIYIPIDTKKRNAETLKTIPQPVQDTCTNMYQVMFGHRRGLTPEGLSGMVRGQILTFFATNSCSKPEETKLIGIEVFNDLRYLEDLGYLSAGDYSYDAIDVRSSLESMMEVRHHIGKDKKQIMDGVIKLGVIPGEKLNPCAPSDPMYTCYECLRIYNGLLKYGRNKA